MKSSVSLNRSLIAIAVGTVLALGAVADASAARRPSEVRDERAASKGGKASAQEALFPNAKRAEPATKASSKFGPKLQKMADKFNDGQM